MPFTDLAYCAVNAESGEPAAEALTDLLPVPEGFWTFLENAVLHKRFGPLRHKGKDRWIVLTRSEFQGAVDEFYSALALSFPQQRVLERVLDQVAALDDAGCYAVRCGQSEPRPARMPSTRKTREAT